MSGPDYVAKVEELLRRVSLVVTHRGREHLGDFNITPPQFSALLALIDAGEITMGELCQKLFLACSTVTDLIDRMEKNAYVERFRDAKDRRVVRLRVLPGGMVVYDEVLKTRREYLESILTNLNEPEKEQLRTSLQQIYSLMKPE